MPTFRGIIEVEGEPDSAVLSDIGVAGFALTWTPWRQGGGGFVV